MPTEFTPITSFAGGALIGLAAVVFMATCGRIAGISGIVSSLLPPAPNRSNAATGIALIAGLLLAAPLYQLSMGAMPQQKMVAGLPVLAIAGLLVGVGSFIGNGCTSGHGVCGISRFSQRSIIATATFMVSAIVTVYTVRHVWGA